MWLRPDEWCQDAGTVGSALGSLWRLHSDLCEYSRHMGWRLTSEGERVRVEMAHQDD